MRSCTTIIHCYPKTKRGVNLTLVEIFSQWFTPWIDQIMKGGHWHCFYIHIFLHFKVTLTRRFLFILFKFQMFKWFILLKWFYYFKWFKCFKWYPYISVTNWTREIVHHWKCTFWIWPLGEMGHFLNIREAVKNFQRGPFLKF